MKQALLDADELQTRLILHPLRNTERVLTIAEAEELIDDRLARFRGATV